MARRGLSPEDLRAWAAYGQTLTKLMPGKTRLPVEPAPQAPAPVPQPVPEIPKPALKHMPSWLDAGAAPAGLDRSTWTRFRDSKIRAEARLDLHGYTAARAHHEVRHFLELAFATRMRCVEIITGKGEILARELPFWLNAPSLRPLILGLAYPHVANTGSVRVLLRRVRG